MPQHPFYPLKCPDQRGTLLLTPCPGTLAAGIEESLEALKTAGATALITLMTAEEMTKNRVNEIQAQCAALDLAWFHLPVEDECAPTEAFAELWTEVKKHLHDRLDKGEKLAVHCKGGSGRTGLLAAQILMERGVPTSHAVEQVRALRSNAFTHAAQVDYINRLANTLQS